MLLFGGRSAEHDVSRVTAVAVAKALDPQRYEVVPVGITTDGRWLLSGDAHAMLEAGRDALPAAFVVEGDAVQPPTEPGSGELALAGRDATVGVDVVLPMLHGPVRRRRHHPGAARAGGSALCRRRGARLRGGHGQDHDEARLRERGAPDRALPRVPRRPRPRRVRGRGRCRARVSVLRQAVEHGLVGRRLEGARRGGARGRAHARARIRRVGRRGGDGHRSRDRGRDPRRRPARRVAPRRDRAGRRVLRLRRQVRGWRREAARAGAARRRRRSPKCARSRCGRSSRVGARRWRASTSSTPITASS